MKHLRTLLVALPLYAAGAVAHADGGISLAFGARNLDHSFWQSLGTQLDLAVGGEYAPGDSPIRLTAGLALAYSHDSEERHDRSALLSEWSFGLKASTRSGGFRPYIGGGVAFVEATYDETVGSGWFEWVLREDDGTATGYYATVGAVWRQEHGTHVGLDLRWLSGTDMTLLEQATSVDGIRLNVTINWFFERPARPVPAAAQAGAEPSKPQPNTRRKHP